jgi:hypothetical protein
MSPRNFGFFIDRATVAGIVLAIVLFPMPTAIPVTCILMSYASVVFVFFAMISLVWYIVHGRHNFTGPQGPVEMERERHGQVVGEDLGRVTP